MNIVIFLIPFPLLLASPPTSPVGTQPSPPTNGIQHPYARLIPSTAIIIVVLIAALYFMGFFSIYIRPCSDSPVGAGSIRTPSPRSQRTSAARGLDMSVIESFPTFSYSEVKDHQICNASLECAICLNEFMDDETLRLLPQCDHVFHPECIGAWFGSHVTCPVCRANLSPSPTAEDQHPELFPDPSASGEVILQVVEYNDRSESRWPATAGRSWSIKMPKVAVCGGPGKFRSHTTGHSMVYPGENLERFTLRLPVQVRKEVMDRASLNLTVSLAAAAALPSQVKSCSARFYRRIEREGRSSNRWGFSTRTMSVEGGGSEGGSGRMPVKMPSLKCLKPNVSDDETGLFFHESTSNPDNETFVEDGVAMEPFNLEKERDDGYFDENGNYVEYVRQNEIKDAWLDSVDVYEKFAGKSSIPLSNDEKPRDLATEELAEMNRRIADALEPGETVLRALRRFKGSTDKKQKMSAETKQVFDQLTEDAMKLMENGDYNVYDEKQEHFAREAEGYERLANARKHGINESLGQENSDDIFDIFGEDDGSAAVENPAPEGGDLQNDYVYDESSGYYYSSSLGYYYDPSSGLYCSAASGKWYSYNEDSATYDEVAQQDTDMVGST